MSTAAVAATPAASTSTGRAAIRSTPGTAAPWPRAVRAGTARTRPVSAPKVDRVVAIASTATTWKN
ncbi:hypothetical protein E2R59_16540 [Kocuria rosea]|uniref:Uncharacterized protein n=1 Tax=Kocuria rosea TaxID=1275 RepID=A0A4R5Y266_KOCRO|nr:hypothetical protein E2R59_16540 [Kocuria rosea]